MDLPTYAAHFDGEFIRLDEPVAIPPNAALVVTILPPGTDVDLAAWANFSAQGLSAAFGDDEPDYGVADLR